MVRTIRQALGLPASRLTQMRCAPWLWPMACFIVAGRWGGARAQDVDTEEWTCRFCPFESGFEVSSDVGTGYVSDDSTKFGDFTGLNEKGLFLIADADMHWWRSNGGYWQLSARDLGLDSRAVSLDGGMPGRYRLRFEYDELPKYSYDSTQTPFVYAGGAAATLPSDWVRSGTTRAMTALPDSLRPVDIEQQRKTFGLGLEFQASMPFTYAVEYRHQDRDGSRIFGGSFVGISALLPEPVAYTTDELDASMSYAGGTGQFEISYYGSFFDNKHAALRWQTPFKAVTAGADAGMTALAPDNEAHQVSLSGSYAVGTRTHVSGIIATGELRQDEAFLSYTINPQLSASTPPRASLSGEVRTTTADIRAVMQATSRLRITAHYDYDERDNRTVSDVYDFVESDSYLAGSRLNIPYAFSRRKTVAEIAYRLPRRIRLRGGAERDVHERTFQERSESDEDTLWTKISLRVHPRLEANISFSSADRTGSDYRRLDLGSAPQNPLMRKHYLADRDRKAAEVSLAVTPTDRVNLTLSSEISDDRYPGTMLGLTRSEMRAQSLDASFILPRAASAYMAWGKERIEFEQAGSQQFSTPDWTAASADETETASVGIAFEDLRNRFDLSVDYTRTDSRGTTDLLVGSPVVPFPDFSTRLNSTGITLGYDLSSSLTLRFGYRRERYRTQDWMLDAVDFTTVPNILMFGATSPNYDVSVLLASFSYTPLRN